MINHISIKMFLGVYLVVSFSILSDLFVFGCIVFRYQPDESAVVINCGIAVKLIKTEQIIAFSSSF